MQFFGKDLNPFLRLWIGERIVPTSSPKSRISGFLACLNPPEESLESQIYPFLDILEGLSIYVFKFRFVGFPDWEKLICLIF
jgi:hypothetical protein